LGVRTTQVPEGMTLWDDELTALDVQATAIFGEEAVLAAVQRVRPPAVPVTLASIAVCRRSVKAELQRMVPAYALVLVRSDGTLGPSLHRSSLTCTRSDNSLTDVPRPDTAPRCGTQVTDGALHAGGLPIETSRGCWRIR
jgi:hypothetical protein